MIACSPCQDQFETIIHTHRQRARQVPPAFSTNLLRYNLRSPFLNETVSLRREEGGCRTCRISASIVGSRGPMPGVARNAERTDRKGG